jgi:hypothetical protein
MGIRDPYFSAVENMRLRPLDLCRQNLMQKVEQAFNVVARSRRSRKDCNLMVSCINALFLCLQGVLLGTETDKSRPPSPCSFYLEIDVITGKALGIMFYMP